MKISSIRAHVAALGDHKKPQLGCLVARAAGEHQDLRKKSLGPMQSPQSQIQVPGTFPVSLSPAIGQVSISGNKTRFKWGRGDPPLQLSKSIALSICK